MKPDATAIPIAQGVPTAQGSNSGGPPVAVATAMPVNIPEAIPSFEVAVPRGMGPGSGFMIQVGPEQHEIVVPEGATGGQTLSCIVVPPYAYPGTEVIVRMKEGEMAVTIPDMAPGEVLIVDVGSGLEQWVGQEPWAPMESLGSGSSVCRRAGSILAITLALLLFLWLISSLMRPRHPYGGGYGGGYGGFAAQPVHPGVSEYKQHLLDNRNVQYGASPPPPIDPAALDPDAYPGKEVRAQRAAHAARRAHSAALTAPPPPSTRAALFSLAQPPLPLPLCRRPARLFSRA